MPAAYEGTDSISYRVSDISLKSSAKRDIIVTRSGTYMKRTICIIIYMFVILACAGCSHNSDTVALSSGIYYAEGDYEEGLTPYVSLHLDDNTFSMGAGSLFSFAANGSFVICSSAFPPLF